MVVAEDVCTAMEDLLRSVSSAISDRFYSFFSLTAAVACEPTECDGNVDAYEEAEECDGSQVRAQ